MRRLLALIAAVLLLGSLASTSAAAGPTALANHFTGNFNMVDAQGHVVGHLVASFGEPSDARMVPGTLDVTWAWYDPAGTAPFLFMDFKGAPVRESHAQLLGSWFMQEQGTEWAGDITIAGASGYLCDYAGPWNSDCRPFYVQFQTHTLGAPREVLWGLGTTDAGDPDAPQVQLWPAVGAFALTYAGPTGG